MISVENMKEEKELRKSKYRFSIFVKCILAIIILIVISLALDAINITGTSLIPDSIAKYISNVNFDKFEVVVTVIITLGLFITTYCVQDLSKEKKYQEDSFDAMCLVLVVMTDSYLTISENSGDYILELNKVKNTAGRNLFKVTKKNHKTLNKVKNIAGRNLLSEEILFFQSYPFKNYEKLISRYAANGLISTVLIEKYIRYKSLFGRMVVQYIRNDQMCGKTFESMENLLMDSIKFVREATILKNQGKMDSFVKKISGRSIAITK